MLFLIFEGPPRVYLLHRYGLKALREQTEEDNDEYDLEEDYEHLEHCHWAQEKGENGANSCGWGGLGASSKNPKGCLDKVRAAPPEVWFSSAVRNHFRVSSYRNGSN